MRSRTIASTSPASIASANRSLTARPDERPAEEDELAGGEAGTPAGLVNADLAAKAAKA